MPIIDFGPRPCPAGCGQLLDIETYAAVYYRSGGPYPDDLIEWMEDESGRIISIACPEIPAAAIAEAMEHWLKQHAGA